MIGVLNCARVRIGTTFASTKYLHITFNSNQLITKKPFHSQPHCFSRYGYITPLSPQAPVCLIWPAKKESRKWKTQPFVATGNYRAVFPKGRHEFYDNTYA